MKRERDLDLVETKNTLDAAILKVEIDIIKSILKTLIDYEWNSTSLKDGKTLAIVVAGLKKNEPTDQVKRNAEINELAAKLISIWKNVASNKISPKPEAKPIEKVLPETKKVKKEEKEPEKEIPKVQTETIKQSDKQSFKSSDLLKLLPKFKEPMREFAVKKLATTIDSYHNNPEQSIEIAIEIEACLVNHFQDPKSSEYKSQMLNINFNLGDAKNKKFRQGVISGAICPTSLPTLKPIEMASDEIVAHLEQLERQRIHEMSTATNSATTDFFRCGKCKQKKCSYFQLQTRSADEPMTTFITCHSCGHKWKC